LLGALVAAATLIFTLIIVWINERTTTAEEEGLITDRINAAVASLGVEKTIKKSKNQQTVSNIEVRIGAILALERMAKKNADVHIQIMEILTTYIRENAPVTEEEHDRKPRQDIQLAFTVIGRRPPRRIALERMHDFRLDLRNCDLTRIDGQGLNFANSRFQESCFFKSVLNEAKLQGAILTNARVKDAEFGNANLQDAHLSHANSINAFLAEANLQGAPLNVIDLQYAILDGANLLNAQLLNANLRGTDLRYACLQNAALDEVNLLNADVRSANMQGAYLTNSLLKNTALFNTTLFEVGIYNTAFKK